MLTKKQKIVPSADDGALSRCHPDYADEFAEFLTLEAPFRR